MPNSFGSRKESPGEEKMEKSSLMMHKRAKSQTGMGKSRRSKGLMRKGMKIKAMGHSKVAKR